MNSRPPPTIPADDGHLHKRASDPAPVAHRRWYDSTKIQVSALLIVIGSWVGAAGVGFSTRDYVMAVRGIEGTREAQERINENLQRQITTNTESIMQLDRQFTELSVVVMEIHCIITAATSAQVRECQSEEARRRMRSITRSRLQNP